MHGFAKESIFSREFRTVKFNACTSFIGCKARRRVYDAMGCRGAVCRMKSSRYKEVSARRRCFPRTFECSPMRLARWPPAEIGTAIPRFRNCFRQRPVVVESISISGVAMSNGNLHSIIEKMISMVFIR